MLTVNKTESEKSRSFFKTNWLNSKRVNLCQPYGLFVEHLQIAHSFVFLHLKEELKNSENFLQGRPPKNDQIIGCPYGLGSSSFLFIFKILYCYNRFNINIIMKYLFPVHKLNTLLANDCQLVLLWQATKMLIAKY